MSINVYVFKGDDPSALAYEAIQSVFADNAEGKSVLLKVNTGFKGPACSGLCTHPEVVRGLIRFFRDQKAGKIYVGDSSIVGVNSDEALESAGITQVCREENVECLNLDDSGVDEVEIPRPVIIEKIKMSRLPFQVDFLISVPVIKTHMYAGATLSIKNLKGCLYQKDKTRLHRINKEVPDINRGKCLDYGITDLSKVCYPDYSIADGTVAMEGFGPSGGMPVNLGVVVASHDAVACDMTCLKLMGMEMTDVPHIDLVAEEKHVSPEDIVIHPANYMDWSHKFLLADEHDLHLSFPNPKVLDKGACSACHASLIQFFRYHHHEFTDGPEMTMCIGRDLTEEDLKGENIVVVGNCTAKWRDRVPFCKGCPPVPSQITRTLHAMETLDD